MKSLLNIFKGFAIAAMALATVSCSKQNDGESSIIGDWKAEYATQKSYENGVLKVEEIYYINGDVMLVSIEPNGKAYVITYEEDDIDADVSVMNWALDGNTLKLANSEFPEEVTVVTLSFLSPDRVAWEFAIEDEGEDSNGDGVVEKSIVSYTMCRVK